MGIKEMHENPDKLKIMYTQTKILVENKIQYLKIPCAECKKETVLIYLYKCLYCGLFYCKKCAKKHFK